MTALLKIVDEHFGKGRDPAFELRLASERITARELIQRRIAEEIAQINAVRVETLNRSRSYLVRLAPAEAALNSGASRRPPRKVELDEAEESAAAVRAFQQNRFILLFDNRQISDLDEEITITPTSEMVFLRLVPLVGG